jgi:hypothetical protein
MVSDIIEIPPAQECRVVDGRSLPYGNGNSQRLRQQSVTRKRGWPSSPQLCEAKSRSRKLPRRSISDGCRVIGVVGAYFQKEKSFTIHPSSLEDRSHTVVIGDPPARCAPNLHPLKHPGFLVSCLTPSIGGRTWGTARSWWSSEARSRGAASDGSQQALGRPAVSKSAARHECNQARVALEAIPSQAGVGQALGTAADTHSVHGALCCPIARPAVAGGPREGREGARRCPLRQ